MDNDLTELRDELSRLKSELDSQREANCDVILFNHSAFNTDEPQVESVQDFLISMAMNKESKILSYL